MRKFILMMLITIMSFCFSSCALSQSIYVDYQRVYFDHVIHGHVLSYDYVFDGTYSYHILGVIPHNVYWELYPCGCEVYLYSKQMERIRLFEWTRRSIYYNRTHHNYYKFDDRHRPPHFPHNHTYNKHIDNCRRYHQNGGNYRPNNRVGNHMHTQRGRGGRR